MGGRFIFNSLELRAMADAILEARNLSKNFGAFTAVDDITLSIPHRSLVSVIGPNGAGKTTLFNLISGNLDPTSGNILYEGEPIDHLPVYDIASRGIARSFQITNFYPELPVKENIRLAVQAQHGSKLDLLRNHRRLDKVRKQTDEILDRVGLEDVESSPAGDLSHGQQRHLEVGIALGSNPNLLLLDEPTAGMSTEETAEITQLIDELANEITLLMVEHDMEIVMDVSDQVIVMDRGMLLASGTPAEVREDESVQDVYLRRD